MDSSNIFKYISLTKKDSVKKNNIGNTYLLFFGSTFLNVNKFCLKKIDVPTAVSFNKLQNSQTNEDKLTKNLTI